MNINWMIVKSEILFDFLVNYPSVVETYFLKELFYETIEQQFCESTKTLNANVIISFKLFRK